VFLKSLYWFVLSFAVFSLMACVTNEKEMNLKKSEAFEIAYKHISPKYPSAPEEIEEWEVYYEDGKWYIYPKLDEQELGGGLTAEVDDNTKKVIKIYFSE
jgi:hypothetical protein